MSNHRNPLFLSVLPMETKGSHAKVMSKVDIPPPKPSTLPANHYTYEKVDEETVKRAAKQIYAARMIELKNLWDRIKKSHQSKTSYIDTNKLNDPAWSPAAKDMSVRPAIFHMTQSNPHPDDNIDPRPIPREKVSLVYISTMAGVGKRRGFDVHVQHHNSAYFTKRVAKNMPFKNLTFLHAHHARPIPWIEDCCAFVPAGITIPAPPLLTGIQSKDDEIKNDKRVGAISDVIFFKEVEQLYGPQKYSRKETRDELQEKFPFATAHKIARASTSESKSEINEVIHRALASHRNIRANLTHIDGGNVLIGILKNGQRYALVGRNSVEFSRNLLWKQLKDIYGIPIVPLTDDIMRYFIAIDLGVPPENVVFVYQADYHLDCAMMLLNGEVIVNDSRQARALELKWFQELGHSYAKNDLDELNKINKQSERQARLEDRAAKDIQTQLPSLPVHRAALCFRNEFGPMYFCNGEGGTDIHRRQFFVTNGGILVAELYFRKLMHSYGIEVEFVPSKESQCSLDKSGGLGCRAKCEERVNLLSALPVAPRTAGRHSLPNHRHNLFSSAAPKDLPSKTVAAAKRFMSAI